MTGSIKIFCYSGGGCQLSGRQCPVMGGDTGRGAFVFSKSSEACPGMEGGDAPTVLVIHSDCVCRFVLLFVVWDHESQLQFVQAVSRHGYAYVATG